MKRREPRSPIALPAGSTRATAPHGRYGAAAQRLVGRTARMGHQRRASSLDCDAPIPRHRGRVADRRVAQIAAGGPRIRRVRPRRREQRGALERARTGPTKALAGVTYRARAPALRTRPRPCRHAPSARNCACAPPPPPPHAPLRHRPAPQPHTLPVDIAGPVRHQHPQADEGDQAEERAEEARPARFATVRARAPSRTRYRRARPA